MNREEILERSRNSRNDEMERQIKDKSFKWIYIVMTLAAAFFALIRGLHEQPIMDLCATVCFSVCAGNLYRAHWTRDKFSLRIGILMLIVGIAATIRFFMGH